MNIKDFIEEYNNASEKDIYVKSHIVENYIPYEKKVAICRNIIDTADYTPNVEATNNKYYSPNTPIRFVLFCMSIIDSYTDIEPEEIDDKRDVMGGFNLLESNGVFKILFRELDKEYNTLNNVMQMMVEDTINKENCLVSFLSSKFDAIQVLYDTIYPYIEEQIKKKIK